MDELAAAAKASVDADGTTWWVSGTADAFYVGQTYPDGRKGASFYTRGWGGGSEAPFNSYVVAGFLPLDASNVRIEEGGEVIAQAESEGGAWIAVIPWGNRDCELRLIFEDSAGEPLAEEEAFLYAVQPSPRG